MGKNEEEERIKESSDREPSRGPIHLLLHLRIRFVYREPFEASSVSLRDKAFFVPEDGPPPFLRAELLGKTRGSLFEFSSRKLEFRSKLIQLGANYI